MHDCLVSVNQLNKVFADFTAVKKISFSVKRGSVLGFIGPNGAGKTTTMRMIMGFLRPSSGTVSINGQNVTADDHDYRKHIGYLPEGAPLYTDMTPYDFLCFIGRIRQLKKPFLQQRLDYVVEQLHLQPVLHRSIETLSKGFKRRVALAQAILHDPDILILDEPTDGLDPNQKHEVRQLIASMAKDKAIIISTHILEEVESLCDNVVLINQGKIIAQGTPTELTAHADQRGVLSLETGRDITATLKKALSALNKVSTIDYQGKRNCTLTPKEGQDINRAVSKCLHEHNIEILALHPKHNPLEQAFRTLTTKHAG